MGIIEVERVAKGAIQQSGDGWRIGAAVAAHRGLTLGVESECREHREQGRGRFRIFPRPHGAAEKIQRQGFRALQHVSRNVVVFQIGDVGCERCGFVCHENSSAMGPAR